MTLKPDPARTLVKYNISKLVLYIQMQGKKKIGKPKPTVSFKQQSAKSLLNMWIYTWFTFKCNCYAAEAL